MLARYLVAWLRNKVHHVNPWVLTLPYFGSSEIDTKILLNPEEFFTRIKYRRIYPLLRKPVSIPLTIRPRNDVSHPTHTKLSLYPGAPMVAHFGSVLAENNLPLAEDYTFEFCVEVNRPYAIVQIQMRDFASDVWSGFLANWINVQRPGRGFVMLNPKFRITEQCESVALLSYPSTEPSMPDTNEIKYIVCDRQGTVVVKGTTLVQKNSFTIIPTREERANLDGDYTVLAQGRETTLAFTINRDQYSRLVTLEHTQAAQKYNRNSEDLDGVADLKRYWGEKVALS